MSDTGPVGATDGRRPHKVVATIDKWGVHLSFECPYTLADRRVRRCNLGTEAERCDYRDFENGEHHWDCAKRKDRNALCSGSHENVLRDAYACWAEEPPECDGFDGEAGHLHPVEGCWAQELVGEIGWEDAVAWKILDDGTYTGPTERMDLPILVDLWSDDEGVQIVPWEMRDA